MNPSLLNSHGHCPPAPHRSSLTVLPRALQNKQTPLHLAAQWGQTDTMEALLQHKANIEAKDKVSDTLQHALPEGSEGRGVMRRARACEG